MAYQSLGLGTTAGDGTGDTIRDGGDKINDNFEEIYTLLGTGTALSSGISATATVVTLAAPSITGVASFADGSPSAPAITNTGDADTGIYFSAANTVAVTTGGTLRASVTSAGLDVVADVTAATFQPDGDTAAGDNAAIGYTSVLGLILTGEGSTNDVTIVNDADTTVMGVATGTTTVNFAGQVTGTGFTGTLDGVLGSGTAAAATVTTLTTSGVASIDDTTDTTSGTTGSIHTDGGVGIAAALFVGTTSKLVGVTTHGGNVVSDTDSTDDLGTTGVRWANLFVDAITATDQITATGFTGTLDGILGSGAAAAATTTTLASTTITASGIIKTDDATDATSTTDGSLQTDGGLSVVKDVVIGGDIKVKNIGVITAAGTDFESIVLNGTDGSSTDQGDSVLREDGGRVMSETSSSLSLGGGGLVGFSLDGPLTIGGGLTFPSDTGTSGQVLKSAGAGATSLWATASAAPASVQVFTSSGTWTKPAGITSVMVELCGGGGQGGTADGTDNGSAGGGGGGYARELLDVTSYSSQTVTIGAGGSGNGGTTSFGSLLSATGGTGGDIGKNGGHGGVGSGGDLNSTGNGGGSSDQANSTAQGHGGGSYFGGGAQADTNGHNPVNGTSFGGGGSGASSDTDAGGLGFAGVVIVTEYA